MLDKLTTRFGNNNKFLALGQKGVLVTLDQGLFALVNFIANIVLARSLGQDEYGAFAIVFAIYALILRPYSALIIEPMSIMLPNSKQRDFSSHFRNNICLHYLLTIPFGLIIFLIGILLRANQQPPFLYQQIMIMGLLVPFLLFFLIIRQIFYILGKPLKSVIGSLIYFFGMLILLLISSKMEILTANLILVGMGIMNVIASIIMIKLIDFQDNGWSLAKIRNQLRINWDYGKWMVLSSVFIAIATEGPILMVSGLASISSAGILKAAQNIIRPVQVALLAITQFALPSLSKDYLDENQEGFRLKNTYFKIILVGIPFLYAILVYLFRFQVEKLLYAGKYSSYVSLFVFWAVIMVFRGMINGYSLNVRARQKPILFALSSIVWAFVSIVAGYYLIPDFNVWGVSVAVMAGFIGAILSLLVMDHLSSEDKIDQ